jgi:serine/threonine protein kinase
VNAGKTGQVNYSRDNLDRDRGDKSQQSSGGNVENKPISFAYASGSTPLEGYTIKRGIGVGGFGEVYFAVSDGGKEVALKKIQRNLDIELRGVRQCLNLKHPNLVDLFDIRHDDQQQGWVVMEYISGENLKQLLDHAPSGMPLDEAAAWIHGITSGVAHLHRHGIVHRDLKPANIFFDDGLVKVGDYGLSKFISCSRQSGQTESVGTFHYMAPEIGKGDYGKQIDVYALGIMLFEMITGEVPFEGESSQEIIMKHLTDEPDLSQIDSRFKFTIGRALEKDPEKRFSDAVELLEVLSEPDYDKLGSFATPSRTVNLQPSVAPSAEAEKGEPVASTEPVGEPTSVRSRRRRKVVPGKWKNLARDSLQSAPTSQRVTQLLGSLLKATFICSILTLIMLPIGGIPFDSLPGALPLLGWMLTINVACCWMVLSLGCCWESSVGDGTIRRLVMFIGGAGIGVLAYLTAHYLNLPLADLHGSSGSPEWPWMVGDMIPDLTQFVLSYGLLFCVLRWWKQADSLRWFRLSLVDVIACACVAWLIPIVPLPWGFMMVAAISITVQASAPWMAPGLRHHYKIEARYQ